MDIDIVRRIAERGLRLAKDHFTYVYPEDTHADDYIDLFQHILDELERLDELEKIET